ncbi:hypothetical protein AHiyo8_49270 [Arthrobacter sp. Hiyo8]|nr:hypothetical protein AHiyo8_49270 [Arthrobacter sp. Hiyo8]
MSLFLTALAGVLLLAAGSLLLPLLGSGYASAWTLLPVLVPALMLTCVTQIYYGVCRSTGRLAESTVVAIAACVLAVGPARLSLSAMGSSEFPCSGWPRNWPHPWWPPHGCTASRKTVILPRPDTKSSAHPHHGHTECRLRDGRTNPVECLHNPFAPIRGRGGACRRDRQETSAPSPASGRPG